MPRGGNKIALFIDGANLYATAKTLGFDIDYKRLLKEFQSHGTLVRAFYFTAISEDQELSSIRPLIDWLDYNGFTVVTKSAKEFDDGDGRLRLKRNMSVELAIGAMEMAEHVDQIVLFSGDGDFRSLVEAVQRRGVRVAATPHHDPVSQGRDKVVPLFDDFEILVAMIVTHFLEELVIARIEMLRALNRHVERVFNSDRKDGTCSTDHFGNRWSSVPGAWRRSRPLEGLSAATNGDGDSGVGKNHKI
jgi:uncharacterized LabA/DUF88 family protein